MSMENRNKLKRLLIEWPKNTVAVNEWLHTKGISDQLKQKYLKSNWITYINKGAVIRTGDTFRWEGAIYSLQTQLMLPIHVGGKTAIELQGHAHYVRLGQPRIELFGQKGVKLPTWFKNYKWQEEIKYFTSEFLPPHIALNDLEVGEFSIKISSLERAIFEYLYKVNSTIDEAYYLMENLSTLRPTIIQELLESCKSIKVKRLFLYLAEKASSPWFEALDISKINLGKGPRQIVKSGYLDTKYQITLPISFKPGINNESIF